MRRYGQRTLYQVADDYEREARSLWTSQRTRWALRDSASLFRRMVCNRQAVDPTRLTITWTMLIDIPERWCRQHGYRAVAGQGGYVIQRDGEPVIVAGIGDTLEWDGQRLAVQN
ncbi:hypothetical protein SUDANB1_07168 [Streptomyces sp. enrichment culture]|uniref:hypothetical protein n=1 Tax=Streptomyces sp. enrichment culture TaxID=1795815 RepID=UPI003F57DB19